jgi:hypothetical protein
MSWSAAAAVSSASENCDQMDLVSRPEPDWARRASRRSAEARRPIGPESRAACDLNHVVAASRKAPAPQSVCAMVGCHAVAGPAPAGRPNGPGSIVTVPWWAL